MNIIINGFIYHYQGRIKRITRYYILNKDIYIKALRAIATKRQLGLNLHRAKVAKNDEFYTLYEDIEKEWQHYIEQFKDKWIYLPCDTEESNFYKYFVEHFKEYGIKRLTATHINFDGTPSYRLDYDGSEVIKTALNGNGDFRSEECTKIKDECDMVITNPPFSLFREFIKWLQ